MKKQSIKLLIPYLGILFFILSCDSSPEYSISIENEKGFELISSLVSLSKTKIPHKNLRCEINGSNSEDIINDVTVADFLVAFILASHDSDNSSENFSSRITCNKNMSPNCDWNMGLGKTDEEGSGNLILRFDYNSKTHKIDPNSLICIQIP